MIMAHRKIQLYQLDECQSSTINKNRKRMRRRIVKKYSQKLVYCLLEKDCRLILLRGRLSRRTQRDLILFILIRVI